MNPLSRALPTKYQWLSRRLRKERHSLMSVGRKIYLPNNGYWVDTGWGTITRVDESTVWYRMDEHSYDGDYHNSPQELVNNGAVIAPKRALVAQWIERRSTEPSA